MRPLIASIDLSSLKHNFNIAVQTAPDKKIFSVIKANAYGHGALETAKALSSSHGFAVASVEEAMQLRDARITKPILVLSAFSQANEVKLLVNFQLTPVIHTLNQLNLLLEYMPIQTEIQCWLKVDTGMNRLGLTFKQLKSALHQLSENKHLNAIGIMSHFASADELESDLNVQQMNSFNAMTCNLTLPRSMANSAAILAWPDSHYNWVRPGLMLYGISPFSGSRAENHALKPVMHFKSEIIAQRPLVSGQGVGYGHRFIASELMRIGVVPCGYADGYPRQANSGTPVLVDGVRTRTLGSISMDTMCVDLTHIPQANLASKVTFWGPGLPVEEVAESLSTIPYELICRLGARVKREYLGGE